MICETTNMPHAAPMPNPDFALESEVLKVAKPIRKASPTFQVWMCGGGTQSVAIAALIVQGKLPKPDFGSGLL